MDQGNPVKYEVVVCEFDGWDYIFPITEPERISNLDTIVKKCQKEVNSNEDWMGVKIPKLLKTGYLGWSITDDFILHMRPDNAPHDDQYAYVGRFSYDPTTKEFLPQRISSSHSQAINKHGSSRYNKYIRGIYLMDQETILLRPYYNPLDSDGTFNPQKKNYNPEVDKEKTWATINMLACNGLKKNMKIITKANNKLVKKYDCAFI